MAPPAGVVLLKIVTCYGLITHSCYTCVYILQICSPVLYFDLCIMNRLCIPIFIYSALSAPVGTACRVGACSTHLSKGNALIIYFSSPNPIIRVHIWTGGCLSTHKYHWIAYWNQCSHHIWSCNPCIPANYYLMKMQLQTALTHYIKITKLRNSSCLCLHSLAWKVLGHAKVRSDGAPPRSTGWTLCLAAFGGGMDFRYLKWSEVAARATRLLLLKAAAPILHQQAAVLALRVCLF